MYGTKMLTVALLVTMIGKKLPIRMTMVSNFVCKNVLMRTISSGMDLQDHAYNVMSSTGLNIPITSAQIFAHKKNPLRDIQNRPFLFQACNV